MNGTPESAIPSAVASFRQPAYTRNVISTLYTLDKARDAEFIPLPPMPVKKVVIHSPNFSLDVLISTGPEFMSPDTTNFTIEGITDASQVSIRNNGHDGTTAATLVKVENIF